MRDDECGEGQLAYLVPFAAAQQGQSGGRTDTAVLPRDVMATHTVREARGAAGDIAQRSISARS